MSELHTVTNVTTRTYIKKKQEIKTLVNFTLLYSRPEKRRLTDPLIIPNQSEWRDCYLRHGAKRLESTQQKEYEWTYGRSVERLGGQQEDEHAPERPRQV